MSHKANSGKRKNVSRLMSRQVVLLYETRPCYHIIRDTLLLISLRTMHWNRTKPPAQKVVMPMTEAMNGKSARDVHAKMKRPMGKSIEANIAGTN